MCTVKDLVLAETFHANDLNYCLACEFLSFSLALVHTSRHAYLHRFRRNLRRLQILPTAALGVPVLQDEETETLIFLELERTMPPCTLCVGSLPCLDLLSFERKPFPSSEGRPLLICM